MAKGILYVITAFIITAGSLPIDITNNEQSKQLYINQEFTEQKVDDSNGDDVRWVDFDALREKYEETAKYNDPRHDRSKENGVINPHTPLDERMSDDDVISEIFKDGISLDGTYPAAVDSRSRMRTENVDKENGLGDVPKRSKISINEVLLSRLPFMEKNMNKQDTNEELDANRNNEVGTDEEDLLNNQNEQKSEKAEDSEVEHNVEKSDSQVNKQDANIEIIPILDNKDVESLTIGLPVVKDHPSMQEADLPNLYLDEHKDTVSGFKQGGRMAPSSYITESNDILPGNTNVDNAIDVVNDENNLDNIFGIPKIEHFTLEGANVMENMLMNTIIPDISDPDRSGISVLNISESKGDIRSTSHILGVVHDIGIKNITVNKYLYNDSFVNEANKIDPKPEFPSNIGLRDIFLLPSGDVDPENTNQSMTIDKQRGIRDDLSKSTVESLMLGVGKIPNEHSGNRQSLGLESSIDSTDVMKHLKPNDESKIIESEPLDEVILVDTTNKANKNHLEEISAFPINVKYSNGFEMIKDHKPINEILGAFEQKREAPIEIQLAKKELHIQGDYKSPTEEAGPEKETLVEDINAPSPDLVNIERELNPSEKVEMYNSSQPPIEIQMAKEELHVRAEEDKLHIVHISNNTPLPGEENKRNRSCSPAELDMFKDSFYYDELIEELSMPCLEKNLINTNDNDVYDEVPIVDRDLIVPVISPIKGDSGTIARAVVPANIENIPGPSSSTIASDGSIDNDVLTNLPVVPVRPAPNIQGQNFLTYFQSLPVNLQGLFLRNQNQNSGENIFNRRQRISWRDIMQVLLRPNYSNQGISRTQVPYTVRPNQVLPIYPLNEVQKGLPRNASSENGGGPQTNLGQPLNQVRTLFPQTIANPSSTDLPQPGLNQDIRRYPINTKVNQQPQAFNGGMFSRLGTGMLRGISGLFGAFRNGQANNSWSG